MSKEETLPSDATLQQWAKPETSWLNVLFYIHLHLAAIYGLYLVFSHAFISTTLFTILLGFFAILGVTAGAHRLYSHRSFQASWPLRFFLVLCQTLVGQGSLYDWVLEHRLHHRHHGTDADPFNYNRGFLYTQLHSHLRKTDPNHEIRAKAIDMSDMEADSIVMFQKKFYWFLMPVLCCLLPVNAPADYWGESISNSIFIAGILRYTLVLHMAWLVNSAIAVWGLKPGDKYPADTNMVFLLTKSHWPQYHYLLPWDYRTGEYGSYGTGCTSAFIRVWAALGWATMLRTMDDSSVQSALETAIETNTPILDCLNVEGEKIYKRMERENYLNPNNH